MYLYRYLVYKYINLILMCLFTNTLLCSFKKKKKTFFLVEKKKKHIIMHELTCLLIKHKLRGWRDSFRACLDGVGKEGEWKGVE